MVMLAGEHGTSAFCSKITVPVEASIRMAAGADRCTDTPLCSSVSCTAVSSARSCFAGAPTESRMARAAKSQAFPLLPQIRPIQSNIRDSPLNPVYSTFYVISGKIMNAESQSDRAGNFPHPITRCAKNPSGPPLMESPGGFPIFIICSFYCAAAA